MKLLRSRRSLARNCDGTAAVEFAFIMPLLVTMLLGTYEIANLLTANMKITAATQTAADLVAQTSSGSTLTGANLTAISNAAAQVMTPLPTTAGTLAIAYASIVYTNNGPAIDWTYEWPSGNSAASALHISAIPSSVSGLLSSTNDSVIMVVAQYQYSSPISYVLTKKYTFSETAYDKPRYQIKVPCNTPTSGNTCP